MSDAPYARVAVVVPCHNEEQTIADVIDGFSRTLPGCVVVVADNRSTDRTAEVARQHGAQVLSESRPGKGYAVRRLLADVEADCYVMIDGDATYDPDAAPELVDLVLHHGVDMVNGARVVAGERAEAYRPGHTLGNAMLTWIFQKLFKLQLRDTLSGYRVMSRRFVKSFPTGAAGFEIEAELNAHAATLGVPIGEVDTPYFARPEGSESKLNTYRDGARILRRNLRLFRDARPSLAFALLSLPWLILAAVLLWIAVSEYFSTGLVERFPSLIAGVGALTVGGLIILTGLILERVTRNRIEANRLSYLSYPAPTPLGPGN
ncbi:MAG: glycosyltransferase [Actinobacteria bacterium]|nr:glycosyltransferase [Actinomycetota bacterium]